MTDHICRDLKLLKTARTLRIWQCACGQIWAVRETRDGPQSARIKSFKDIDSYDGPYDSLAVFLARARHIGTTEDKPVYLLLAQVIERLYNEDEKPHEGFINKLIQKSGCTRTEITAFLKRVRLEHKNGSDGGK